MTHGDRSSLLMVAYYFPPWGMGGVQRALKFAKYLPEFGWDVTVVAPRPGRYYQMDPSLLDDLPETVRVERVRACDPSQWYASLLSRRRRMEPGGTTGEFGRSAREWLRWPDEKRGFAWAATRCVRRLLREQPYDCVLTTSPPPSAHLTGEAVRHRVPWVADFRDPWFVRRDDWGLTRWHRSYNRYLQGRIVRGADGIVTVNPEIAAQLDALHPRRPTAVIPNGYDEADFVCATAATPASDEFTVLCPGTFSVYSDPRAIFASVRKWRDADPTFRVRVVHVGAALGIDAPALAAQHGVGDVYVERGYLPHAACVRELLAADLIVAAVSDLPGFGAAASGRVFEALRSLRPFLMFAPPRSGAAELVRSIPGCWVVDGDDIRSGAAALRNIATLPRCQPVRSVDDIRRFDRREQVRRLAAVCDSVRSGRRSLG